jgi:hypothetical protein
VVDDEAAHHACRVRHKTGAVRKRHAGAAARQSLADPDWFLKARLGRGEEVRVCEFTNYCEGLDQKHTQVTCKLWDRVDLTEPGVKRTDDGKRRTTPPKWKNAPADIIR